MDRITYHTGNAKNDPESSLDYGFDFILNKAIREISVKRIGIQNGNILAIDSGNSLLLQPVERKDILKRTINPLRERLEEVFHSCPKEKRLMIINTIMSFLNRNLKLIIDSQLVFVNDSSNTDNNEDESDLEVLYNLAVSNASVLFKDQYGMPYAAVELATHEHDKYIQIIRLYSIKYKKYLARLFRTSQDGKMVSSETIGAVINDIAATIEFDCPTVPLHLRVAWGDPRNKAEPGRIYYDMTDDKGRVIEISQEQGWKILAGSSIPILFRKHNQIPQVEPDRDYEPNIFNQFMSLTNIKSKRSEQLIKVYIVSLLIPDIAHPILTSYGPKGAAFLLKLIKMLVDPSVPVLLTLQKSRDEFIQQINHNYLAFYDNVKFIPYWLSDEICKTITGIGHTKRALYTDDDDIVYEHKHCVSLNGINISLTEPDALDRSIFAELEDIDDESRKREEEVLEKFESIRPKLLAYLFDVLSEAMKTKSTLRLTRLTRMADFTEWGEAISRALGYPDMSFVDAYSENRNEQNIMAVNEDITGSLFVKFFNNYESENKFNPRFIGRPDELYGLLVGFAAENEININYRQFPKVAEILIKKLKNIKSNLKEGFNIIVRLERDSGNCSLITIYRNKGKLFQNADVNKAYALQVLRNHLSNEMPNFE